MKIISIAHLSKCSGTLALVALLWVGAIPAQATLIGDTIGCDTEGGGLYCDMAETVVGDGPEFFLVYGEADPLIGVNVGASSIQLLWQDAFALEYTVLILTGLDWVGMVGEVTGATLELANNIDGLAQGDISFTAHSVTIDLMGTSSDGGRRSGVLISLQTEHSVPEPGTLALLGAGLIGLVLRRKRVA
jgi:hypothetical protein